MIAYNLQKASLNKLEKGEHLRCHHTELKGNFVRQTVTDRQLCTNDKDHPIRPKPITN